MTATLTTIAIQGTPYTIAEMGHKCYRLVKTVGDGPAYDVERAGKEVTCTCPDYQYRRKDLPGSHRCKHGQALLFLGYFPNPEE